MDFYDATFLRNIRRESLTEMRASTVAEGTKMTSGMDLIKLSWGKLSPALLATIAAGGVTSPVKRVELSNLFRLTLFFMKSLNNFSLSAGSFACFHFTKHACSFANLRSKREGFV